MAEPLPFDLAGPLPAGGTHVLEASAGTGKTYAIAALAARYVADGVGLENLMMVTFSRAATQELRSRIREKFVDTEGALRQALAGSLPADTDPIAKLIATGEPNDLADRLQRISSALSDFDTATIATTHEFCGRMLDGLGVLNSENPHLVLADSVPDLVRQCASDLWLRGYASADKADFTWTEAQQIAAEVSEFEGELRAGPRPADQRKVSFAKAVRAELTKRKAALGLRTYHDMLTHLQRLLQGKPPENPDADPDPLLAAEIRERLSTRFTHVLIDEFQDTDPVQWEIVENAFSARSTLILIGDPKQAIYSFRDADVFSYLQAVDTADGQHYTLATNWRSDQALVEVLHHFYGQAELGDPRIRVREVKAHHSGSRFHPSDAAFAGPLRLRTMGAASLQRKPRIGTLRHHVLEDLVADICSLLQSGSTVSVDGPARPVSACDLAVLVNSNHRAEEIRAALQLAGVPAVFAGSTSVYQTPEADDWAVLLRALAAPHSSTIRETALTCFVGWTFTELACASEEQLNRLSGQIRRWARIVSDHGVAALLEALYHQGLSERLLSQTGGERRLTDIRHLAQILHAAATTQHLGIAALADWYADQRRTVADSGDERTRRLDTDRDAVQVMTVHRAKGLQFPIVYLPDLWERWTPDLGRDREEGSVKPLKFHDDGRPVLFFGGPGPERAAAWNAQAVEEHGEDLRKLYVAMTRAQCQVVAWWAWRWSHTPHSPLQRLLFREGARSPALAYGQPRHPSDLLHLNHPLIQLQEVTGVTNPMPFQPPELRGELVARRFDRTLDADWRRTSYSGLTAAAHDQAHATPVVEGREDDELMEAPEDAADPVRSGSVFTGALAEPSPMADLPRGASFGTLVHAIFEHFDPAAENLRESLTTTAAQWLNRVPADGLTAEQLGGALYPAVTTPLGDLASGLRLCDIAAADRLPELDFEYPLAGGDAADPRLRVTLADVAEALRHHLPADDLLADYAYRLSDPLLSAQVLRGFLIGSIDAVLRVREDGEPRYLVIDYKTNWLGPLDSDDPLLIGHYQPAAMAEAMMAAHYPLQALLYCVALHRYLRWRQPDYDPEKHLGGVGYLFVRGMNGDSTPVVDRMPCGVFTWRPPAALILEVSDLLDEGARR